jgi:hypothetical protein
VPRRARSSRENPSRGPALPADYAVTMALPSGHGDGEPQPDPDHDGPSDDEVDRRFAELTAGFDTPQPAPADPTPPAVSGPRDYVVADEIDEPFAPPEPEPLGTADPLLLIAWIGAVGGPIAFILLLLLWSTAPGIVWLTALCVMLAGWAVVIWRLPRSRDDAGNDDGAVV